MGPYGGDERVRTDGLLLARQALSQLSYTPTGFDAVVRFVFALPAVFEGSFADLLGVAPSKLYSAQISETQFSLLQPLRLYTLERR